LEKIKVYDVRVERPPHYNTFAEFQYAYHYGDTYSPFIKHDEPLRTECQHFIECINDGVVPLTSGATGLEVVRILEASSKSLKQQGAPVALWSGSTAPFPILQRGMGNAVRPSPSSGNGSNSGPKSDDRRGIPAGHSDANSASKSHDQNGAAASIPAST
jgi:hypothetical protein